MSTTASTPVVPRNILGWNIYSESEIAEEQEFDREFKEFLKEHEPPTKTVSAEPAPEELPSLDEEDIKDLSLPRYQQSQPDITPNDVLEIAQNVSMVEVAEANKRAYYDRLAKNHSEAWRTWWNNSGDFIAGRRFREVFPDGMPWFTPPAFNVAPFPRAEEAA